VTAIITFGTMDTGTEHIDTASPIAMACTKKSDIETVTTAYDASETPSPRSRRSFRTCGQETSWPSATLAQPASSPTCMLVSRPSVARGPRTRTGR
jgi:hypothetical protein